MLEEQEKQKMKKKKKKTITRMLKTVLGNATDTSICPTPVS
jgi:uncharacterized membrane protein